MYRKSILGILPGIKNIDGEVVSGYAMGNGTTANTSTVGGGVLEWSGI